MVDQIKQSSTDYKSSNGYSQVNNSKKPMPGNEFYTNLHELSSRISKSLNDIVGLIPELYKKNELIQRYTRESVAGVVSEPFSDYFERHKDTVIPELNDIVNLFQFLNDKQPMPQTFTSSNSGEKFFDSEADSEVSQIPNPSEKTEEKIDSRQSLNLDVQPEQIDEENSSSEDISQSHESRRQRAYRDNYSNLVHLMPGAPIPEVDLNSQAKTVRHVWEEWQYGHKGRPALREMENKWGTRWRRGRIAKSAQRRKKVVEFIEKEYKKHENTLDSVEVVIDELERYRLTRGKGLFWLYGSIPDRLYDEEGKALQINDGQLRSSLRFQQTEIPEEDVEMQIRDVLNSHKDKKKEEEITANAVAAVFAHEERSQPEPQSTEGDLRRLGDIQRLIDQHNVTMDEIGENTDPALAKL
ncbi:hypothetical protein DAMA08_050010 [Martiniozyma asiatica (nom. inval.)]|nr:hypothetical protein DAMA08_050010 [Martiniozyma asiatica]